MTPESITVSLDLAKQLKEVGWEQQGTQFWWCVTVKPYVTFNPQGVFAPHEKRIGIIHGGLFAAPTAEEILRRLPPSVPMKSDFPNMEDDSRNPTVYLPLRIKCGAPKRGSITPRWMVLYRDEMNEPACIGVQIEDTLADAAARMYCYLSSHNLLP